MFDEYYEIVNKLKHLQIDIETLRDRVKGSQNKQTMYDAICKNDETIEILGRFSFMEEQQAMEQK